MSNKIFIDTSILVEYIKKSKTTLLNNILGDDNNVCYINETVVSEFLFQYVKVNTGKAPRSLQEAEKIPQVIQATNNYMILNLFNVLPASDNLLALVPSLMAKYNLLPNDAIILATCKAHGISKLASHDSDFIVACETEGIDLLSE